MLEASVFNEDDDVYDTVARASHFTLLIWLLKNLRKRPEIQSTAHSFIDR